MLKIKWWPWNALRIEWRGLNSFLASHVLQFFIFYLFFVMYRNWTRMGNTGSNGAGRRRRRSHPPPPPHQPPQPEISANRYVFAASTPYPPQYPNPPQPPPPPYYHQYPGYYPPPPPQVPGTYGQPYGNWVGGHYPYGAVPTPVTPYVEHQKAITIRNDINIKKDTLRIEPDEDDPGKFLAAFTFDATVPGR